MSVSNSCFLLVGSFLGTHRKWYFFKSSINISVASLRFVLTPVGLVIETPEIFEPLERLFVLPLEHLCVQNCDFKAFNRGFSGKKVMLNYLSGADFGVLLIVARNHRSKVAVNACAVF